MTDSFAIVGASVWTGARFETTNVVVSGESIASVSVEVPCGVRRIEAHGQVLLPGLLDCHVHFREPGLERKEGWAFGSRGAVHGGVTSVLEIQNNPPLTVSLERLREREAIVERGSLVDFGLFPNLVFESMGELGAMAPHVPGFKLFMGASTGMPGITDYGLLRDLFQAAAAVRRPVVVHAEDESILRRAASSVERPTAATHHRLRPPEAETVAVAASIELAAATGASLHVFHVSTARAGALVADARRAGLPVSASTSPHYLLLTHEDSERLGNLLKVNPSVKAARDRDGLLALLADGTLEAIGTDHAPHPLAEKERSYAEAPSGLPTVDLVLPLAFAIHDRGVPLARVIDSLTTGPARCFGIERKGRIAAGFDADLVLARPDARRVVRGGELPSRSRWSVYEGMELRGFATEVYRRGARVFGAGAPVEGAGGRRVPLTPP